jgi:folylpolyglutamate synthase/dihydropteroate synthase
MQDKDYKQILQSISKISNIVFVVKAKTERSRSSEEIGLVCKQLGIKSRIFNNVVEGVSVALRTKDLPVLMTGSHFVVGEGLAYLQSEKYLTINQ